MPLKQHTCVGTSFTGKLNWTAKLWGVGVVSFGWGLWINIQWRWCSCLLGYQDGFHCRDIQYRSDLKGMMRREFCVSIVVKCTMRLPETSIIQMLKPQILCVFLFFYSTHELGKCTPPSLMGPLWGRRTVQGWKKCLCAVSGDTKTQAKIIFYWNCTKNKRDAQSVTEESSLFNPFRDSGYRSWQLIMLSSYRVHERVQQIVRTCVSSYLQIAKFES